MLTATGVHPRTCGRIIGQLLRKQAMIQAIIALSLVKVRHQDLYLRYAAVVLAPPDGSATRAPLVPVPLVVPSVQLASSSDCASVSISQVGQVIEGGASRHCNTTISVLIYILGATHHHSASASVVVPPIGSWSPGLGSISSFVTVRH